MLSTTQTRRRDWPSETEREDPFSWALDAREKEVAQSCPTFSDPMEYSLPGSSIHGILQVRVPEWGAIAFSASIPRQVDKKSEVPKEEKGVWGS